MVLYYLQNTLINFGGNIMRFILAIIILFPSLAKAENVIDTINQRVSQITSLSGKTYNVGRKGFVVVSSTGDLYYQKPHNFRMINIANVGKNLALDMGSTQDVFWFWSKNVKPTALYWCRHADLYKARLEESLHPLWLIEILGVNPIDITDANVYTEDNFTMVAQARMAPGGKQVIKLTKIDTANNVVTGHYIYTVRKTLVSSCEIKSFNQMGIPRECEIEWPQERVSIKFTLGDVIINPDLSNEAYWKFPDYKPVKNLAQ